MVTHCLWQLPFRHSFGRLVVRSFVLSFVCLFICCFSFESFFLSCKHTYTHSKFICQETSQRNLMFYDNGFKITPNKTKAKSSQATSQPASSIIYAFLIAFLALFYGGTCFCCLFVAVVVSFSFSRSPLTCPLIRKIHQEINFMIFK